MSEDNKTTHQFSGGVTILLERIKTHPQDFLSFGRFYRVTEEVYTAMHKSNVVGILGAGAFLRTLTQDEIIALHDALVELERPSFDAWVMKEILKENEEYQEARLAGSGTLGQGTRAKNIYNPYTNNVITNGLVPLAPITAKPDGLVPLAPITAKPDSFWSKVFKI